MEEAPCSRVGFLFYSVVNIEVMSRTAREPKDEADRLRQLKNHRYYEKNAERCKAQVRAAQIRRGQEFREYCRSYRMTHNQKPTAEQMEERRRKGRERYQRNKPHIKALSRARYDPAKQAA